MEYNEIHTLLYKYDKIQFIHNIGKQFDFTYNGEKVFGFKIQNRNKQQNNGDILIIRGVFQPIYTIRHIMFKLAKQGYNVWTINRPDNIYKMEEFVEFYRDFWVSLNSQKSIIIGHSLGGLLSIMICKKYPKLFQKCVVVSAFLGISPQIHYNIYEYLQLENKNFLYQVSNKYQELLKNTQKAMFIESNFPDIKQLANIIKNQNILMQPDYQIYTPLLILIADNEQIISNSKCQEFIKKTPLGQLKKLVNTTHYFCKSTKSLQQFLSIFQQFNNS